MQSNGGEHYVVLCMESRPVRRLFLVCRAVKSNGHVSMLYGTDCGAVDNLHFLDHFRRKYLPESERPFGKCAVEVAKK